MSQVYFKKEGMTNYMVMPCEYEMEETYQSCLLKYHAVPYFLPYEVRQMDGQQCIYYKLRYRTTLKSVLGHLQLTFSRLKNMLISIIGVMEMVEEYLLEQDGIVWSVDQIFLEADTGNLQFCYCPIPEREKGSLRDLLTELIQAVDKKEEKSILFILQFYNMVTEPDCSLESLKTYIGKNNNIPENFMVNNLKDQNEKNDFGLERGGYQQSIEKCRPDRRTENDESDKCKCIPEKGEKEKEPEDKAPLTERVVRTLLIATATINIILIMSLLFNLLTYDCVRYLFVSLGVLIVLTIVYMCVSKEETPDEMMQAFFENGEGTIAREEKGFNERKEEKKEFFAPIEKFVVKEENEVGNKTFWDGNSKEESCGETSVLIGGCKEEENKQDTIVVENYNKYLYLESMEKGKYEPIYMDRESIVLGAMPDSCNYILKARGISRMHAKLMKKADGLYLLDLNSTNGTYLNGEMIESGRDYKLEEGDMVTFALSDFYVTSKVKV